MQVRTRAGDLQRMPIDPELPNDVDVSWYAAQARRPVPQCVPDFPVWIQAMAARIERDAQRIRLLEGIAGRRPTETEDALACYLVRTGQGRVVAEVMQGRATGAGSPHLAIAHLEDLLLSTWPETPSPIREGIRTRLHDLVKRLG